MKTNNIVLIIISGILAIHLLFGHDKKAELKRVDELESRLYKAETAVDSISSYLYAVQNFHQEKAKKEQQTQRHLTDEEINKLREQSINLNYHVHNGPKTQQEVIEDYIEENQDEIHDQYKD